jgi:hypothetical protein
LVVVAAFLYLQHSGIRPPILALLAAIVPVVVTISLAWAAAHESTRSASGTAANVIAHATPRVQFMRGAERLAAAHFPLGEGSGTFGSDLSRGQERAAFMEAGMASQYGFAAKGPQFNSDNFVAHVLGERGYFGLVAWLLSLAALVYVALVSSSLRFPPAVAVAAVALTPVVPVFRDDTAILLIVVPAVLCSGVFVSRGTDDRRSQI